MTRFLSARALRAVRQGSTALGAASLVAALCVGCQVQAHPGPMGGPDEVPPGLGAVLSEGPEEALLIRHGDTVHVQRAGESTPYILHFYEKQERIRAGAAVFTDAGGRAELQFAQGSSVLLNGTGALAVGSPSRGEPLVHLLDLERATLTLSPDEVASLPGGLELSGAGGPYALERIAPDVLEFRNRGRGDVRVSLRDGVLVLSPGDVVHLPVLRVGGRPFVPDPDLAVQGRVGPTPVVLAGSMPDSATSTGALLTLPTGAVGSALGLEFSPEAELRVRLSSLASSTATPVASTPQ